MASKTNTEKRGFYGLSGHMSSEKKEIRLSLGQVAICWAVIAGSMVAVFLFGLFAGRERGLQLALEGQGQVGVRLPVPKNSESSLTGDSTGDSPLLAQLEKAMLNNGDLSGDSKAFVRSEQSATKSLSLTKTHDSEVTNGKKNANPKDVVRVGTGFIKQPALIANNKLVSSKVGVSSPAGGNTKVPRKRPITTGVKGRTKIAQIKEQKVVRPKPSARARLADLTTKPARPARIVKTTKQLRNQKPELKERVVLSPGWYVQLAAKTRQYEAIALVSKVKKLGFDTHIESAVVKRVQYYRVIVGPYKDRRAAQTVERKIKTARVINNMPFLKRIY